MVTIIEIKTPNCSHCKAIEPDYQTLQAKYPDFEYQTLIFGKDEAAGLYAQKYMIRSAPTFLIMRDNDGDAKVCKFEELEEELQKYSD